VAAELNPEAGELRHHLGTASASFIATNERATSVQAPLQSPLVVRPPIERLSASTQAAAR